MNDKAYEKYHQTVTEKLKPLGMESREGNPKNFERYFSGFATVALALYPESNSIEVELYYDNELFDDKYVHNHYTLGELEKAVKDCRILLCRANGDQPIFEGMDNA